MSPTAKALKWIVNILEENKIPFQIAGGLAVNIYGGTRPLEDIDIDIPEDKFELIKNLVSSYIVYGPKRFKSDLWDNQLMTLNYHGQLIDLGGAYTTKIFNHEKNEWQSIISDFSTTEQKNIFGVSVPVISREELIAYKTVLARDVDLMDVKELTSFSD